ncbi:MAG: ABC transporter ATP-binding protein [Candidatus Micrarchaeota archaeon]|nr:ABC transporter ATP-binding protein [Candidatus Micrarchaeota archaeon]
MKKGRMLMKLEDVYKIYEVGEEKVKALDGVNLEISEGEFASIVGPSGSGKSTLLHVLGLLDVPSKGRIILDGVETTKLTQKELAAFRGKKIGFVFQMFNLIPSLTVLENVVLPAIIYEKDENLARAEAVEILKEIDMGGRLNHYPNQLSGGQRQRVAIARALINDPDIILADEPTGNLDQRTGHEVLELFKRTHERGKTVIIVTHDLDIAKTAERTIRIVDGKIVQK